MNLDDLRQVFRTSLDLDDNFEVDQLGYRQIEPWDSVAHMVLIAEVEDRFDVMLDTDDVIDLSSFGQCVTILAKYGVSL